MKKKKLIIETTIKKNYFLKIIGSFAVKVLGIFLHNVAKYKEKVLEN